MIVQVTGYVIISLSSMIFAAYMWKQEEEFGAIRTLLSATITLMCVLAIAMF